MPAKTKTAPDPPVEDAPEPQSAVEDVPPPPEPDPVDAVIVVKKLGPQGDIQTEVILNGKVQATEVQTLLELGLRGWRKQIGLA